MIERIHLATGNPGKAAELERLLGCPVLPIEGWEPPVEDGDSFLANARLKARAGAARRRIQKARAAALRGRGGAPARS